MGRPLKYPRPSALRAKAEVYFKNKEEKEKETGKYQPITLSGLALFLGMTKDALYDYGKRKGFEDTYKWLKAKCENSIEENALQGRINPISAIFNLKNNHGWKDKSEYEAKVDGKIEIVSYGKK